MGILHKKDAQGIIRTYNSGTITMREAFQSVVTLGHLTAESEEIWELILLDEDVVLETDELQTMSIAHQAKETIQFKERGAIAFVAPNSKTLKACLRMADLLSGGNVPVVVFDNKSDAVAWLKRRKHFTGRINTTRLMAKAS